MSGSPVPAPSSRPLPAGLGVLLANPKHAVIVSLGLVGVIAMADHATGYEVRLAVLYLLPVFIATWSAGWNAGTVIAALAALSWTIIFESSHPYSQAIYYYWEGAILFGTLAAFVLILARLRAALEHADERFATVLEGLDAAVYVNQAGRGAVLYTNRRFQDFFGNTGAGNVREFETQFNVEPADFFDRVDMASGQPVALKGEFQDPASGRWYLVHARSVTWVDGRSVSLKVIAEITEAKQAAEAGRQQMEKLQMSAKLLTIGEMASALAHELNQPLAAIASYNQGCVRLLQGGKPDREQLLGFMEKCAAQAVRAGAIINRMREFVRKREPVRSPHDLNGIIVHAAQLIEFEAEKGGVALSLQLGPALPPVLADAIMIEQVLLNLIRNGIEAMYETGSDAKALVISSVCNGDALLQVSVRDGGHGIAPEVAPNLYTPFFSTKESGMGIGLNISRSIIEFHGGKLWHESGTGTGSVFHFTLPAGTG